MVYFSFNLVKYGPIFEKTNPQKLVTKSSDQTKGKSFIYFFFFWIIIGFVRHSEQTFVTVLKKMRSICHCKEWKNIVVMLVKENLLKGCKGHTWLLFQALPSSFFYLSRFGLTSDFHKIRQSTRLKCRLGLLYYGEERNINRQKKSKHIFISFGHKILQIFNKNTIVLLIQ